MVHRRDRKPTFCSRVIALHLAVQVKQAPSSCNDTKAIPRDTLLHSYARYRSLFPTVVDSCTRFTTCQYVIPPFPRLSALKCVLQTISILYNILTVCVRQSVVTIPSPETLKFSPGRKPLYYTQCEKEQTVTVFIFTAGELQCNIVN